ncbi:MAG: NifB/NifX family molybdenum-iron cluster-binding protein [Pseudomonadota bacterium]
MKIVFPTQNMEKGMGSQVYGHFGSAPHFILVDSDLGTYEALGNPDRVHEHGQCQPMAALGGHEVEAVVVGGIGAGALRKLNAAGIKIYRAVEGTVTENLELVKKGVLPAFTLEATCAGHAHGGCTH